jgi:hypothetical protein
MSVTTPTRWLVLGAVAVCLAGCSKVKDERTVTVEPAGYNELTVDPAKSEQTVAVDVESKGNPLNVYLVLGKDGDAAKKDISAGQAPKAAVASKEKQEEAHVEAKVPANEKLLVYLTSAGGKEATAKVKIASK